jgi:hypothetical protein
MIRTHMKTPEKMTRAELLAYVEGLKAMIRSLQGELRKAMK